MDLQSTYNMLKLNYPDAKITQSWLRSDVLLTSTTQNLTFGIAANNINQGSSNLTVKERGFRLKLSDAFCVTAMGMLLYSVSGTDTPTDAQIGAAIDYSYPNPTAMGATPSVQMEALYNANLIVSINKDQIFPAFPTRYFRRVGTSQLGQVTAAIAGPVQYSMPADEQIGSVSGFFPLTPTFNLQGSWDMQFNIQLATGYNMDEASRASYCSLVLQGYLLQNSAQYKF